MKKYIYLSFVAIAGLLSCNDNLNEVPLSTLTPENLFKTTADAEVAVVGIYNGLLEDDNWGVKTPVFGWGIMGTDVWSVNASNKGEQSKFSRYSLSSADEQVKDVWTACYSTINRANIVIENLPSVNASEEVINGYMAEAYFLRAITYMDLVQYFGGVPLRLMSPQDIIKDLPKARASEAEVWQQIFKDLSHAASYLPETAVAGRATKWAAKGMLAKAYLTWACYVDDASEKQAFFEKAAQESYEVISQSGIDLKATTPGNSNAFHEYGQQFLVSGENDPEALLSIQFHGTDFGGGWGYRSISGGLRYDVTETGSYYSFWGGSVISSDFALSFRDDDIRFQWSIGPFGLNNSGRTHKAFAQYMPYKFRLESQPANAWDTSVNAILLRLADVYLIYAEASNEATGNPNATTYGMSAYEAINTVRSRALINDLDDAYLMTDSPYGSEDMLYGMAYESFNKANANYNGRHVYYRGSLQERFRAAVLQERGWELCFERHRWFDLKRTNKLIEFCRGAQISNGGNLHLDALVDPIDKSLWLNDSKRPNGISQAFPCNDIKDYSRYMPIPDVEIQTNPALSQDDQNEGY